MKCKDEAAGNIYLNIHNCSLNSLSRQFRTRHHAPNTATNSHLFKITNPLTGMILEGGRKMENPEQARQML